MTAEEWYRANVGRPNQFPETYQHFLNAYNAGFEAGRAFQLALDAKRGKQVEQPVYLAH